MDGRQRSQKEKKRVFFEQMVRKEKGRKELTEALTFLDVRKGLKAKARGRGQWLHQWDFPNPLT